MYWKPYINADDPFNGGSMCVDQTAFVEKILSLPTMSSILHTLPPQQQPGANPTEKSEAWLWQGGPGKVTEKNNSEENGREENEISSVTQDTGQVKIMNLSFMPAIVIC